MVCQKPFKRVSTEVNNFTKKKGPRKHCVFKGFSKHLCGRWDLNPHKRIAYKILSLARLPVPTLPRICRPFTRPRYNNIIKLKNQSQLFQRAGNNFYQAAGQINLPSRHTPPQMTPERGRFRREHGWIRLSFHLHSSIPSGNKHPLHIHSRRRRRGRA